MGAVAPLFVRPQLWPWALGAVVANHAVITAAGLWPRSNLLGPNWTRLPKECAARGEVALSIDDGPEPAVTPRVLDMLDEHAAKATFFCIGQRVSQHPELAREIVRRGHALENHSHAHPYHFSLLGPRGMAAEVAKAQEVITDVTGQRPRFFRAPAGLRNPFLEPVLERLELRLASWTRRGFDTVNHRPDVVYGKLTRHLGGGDILLLHDGNAAITEAGSPVIFDVLPRLLATFKARQLTPVTLPSALNVSA
ncbi:MAG TPA: polysaccharide deacetylase family protein [Steroidobacteraceae bacterium]|nr:polysaccharide deacetylase family protein [Steroidobacteraceae bacterium]